MIGDLRCKYGSGERRVRWLPGGEFLGSETAQATLETALVLPVVLLCILGFYQLTLVCVGHSVVRYAAFEAARSASVWIPADVASDGPGTLTLTPGQKKRDEIVHGVRMALVAVSPKTTAISDRLPGHLDAAGEGIRGAAAGRFSGVADDLPVDALADKYAYATMATEVEIRGLDSESGAVADFGPFEEVTVTVHHEYYLGVPFADRIFAGFRRRSRFAGGDVMPGFFTVRMSASCTLPIESAARAGGAS